MNRITKGSNENNVLKKSRSLCSLDDELKRVVKDSRFCGSDKHSGHSRTVSECSEVFVVVESDSEKSADDRRRPSSDGGVDGEVLGLLEHKIDRLSDLFQEQCQLLSEIKLEIEDSKDAIEKCGVQNKLYVDIVNDLITQRSIKVWKEEPSETKERSRAKCLLDALEVKQEHALDKEIREALANFLKSDELKERLVSSTASSVRDVIRSCFTRDLSAVYLPVLQRAQRSLARQTARTLEDAFVELEEHSSKMSRDVYRACRQLRRTLEAHQTVLENASSHNFERPLRQTVEALLDKELKQYRQKIFEIISTEVQTHSDTENFPECPLPLEYPMLSPTSPPQPADPEHSAIDQLMLTALINKQIEEGDVNGSFSCALSAADLSLVVAACRAVRPSRAFGPPCALAPPVLLALTQQLATDLLHDTQLKCRYLEEAIISLSTSDPATRSHLPLVLGEVRKHLMKFLSAYPNHVASRRITLIVMAADNLLKS